MWRIQYRFSFSGLLVCRGNIQVLLIFNCLKLYHDLQCTCAQRHIYVCWSWVNAWFCSSSCMDIRGGGGGGGAVGGGATKRPENSWEKKKKRWEPESEKEREVFWPLVAFTTQAQIIEGHGNLSDRWTMLPFSNPLWTGPSITEGKINSIHQLLSPWAP